MRSVLVLLLLILFNHFSYATCAKDVLAIERGIIAHNFVIATVPPLVTNIWAGVAAAGVIGATIASYFGKNSGGNGNSYDDDYSYSYSYSPPPPKDSRNEDEYKNMYEVFDRAPIGQRLKKVTERTDFKRNGSRIYKVIENVKEWGIKKGDWLYLDKMHKDHIEVFKKCGKVMRTI